VPQRKVSKLRKQLERVVKMTMRVITFFHNVKLKGSVIWWEIEEKSWACLGT